jgi:multiple sugar transport system permease protein
VAIGALFMLAPFWFMFVFATHSRSEIFNLPPPLWFGDDLLANFRLLTERLPFWRNLGWSLYVALMAALLTLLFCSMAGYAFALMEFRFKKPLFALVLATMMVPLQVTMVPVFLELKTMGLTDTLLGLIVPAFPAAFGTFLMRQYFLGMPKDLGEAAMIDGAGPWRVFRSVYAPLAAPGLAIVGVLAFNYHWNEFFRPLILETSTENLTLPLGLVSLQGNLGTGSISVVLAGVVLSMIPAVVVFVVGQRPLREGITSAGVNR